MQLFIQVYLSIMIKYVGNNILSFKIYNEMIRDLLNPASGYLDLREDASGNVQVAGISELSTTSTSEVSSMPNTILLYCSKYWMTQL